MQRTILNAALAASVALALVLSLGGCVHDDRDHDHDHDSDHAQHDNDHHDQPGADVHVDVGGGR